MSDKNKQDRLIIIGASTGGLKAITELLSKIPCNLNAGIIVVQHIRANEDEDFLPHYFKSHSKMNVVIAGEKEMIERSTVYIAPPNYHLLIENDKTFSLSVNEKVNFSRPSIDIAFESVSKIYGKNSIGIVLTGANKDGMKGAGKIKERGGIVIAQSPQEAESNVMPLSVINNNIADKVLKLGEISEFLKSEVGCICD